MELQLERKISAATGKPLYSQQDYLMTKHRNLHAWCFMVSLHNDRETAKLKYRINVDCLSFDLKRTYLNKF